MKKLMFSLTLGVAAIAFADRVELKSGTVLTGKVVGTKDGVIKIATDDFGTLDVKPEAVVSIQDAAAKPVEVAAVPAIPKEPETWHGAVNFSGAATRGNTVGESATVTAELSRRWDDDRLTANGGYYFAQSGDSKDSKQKTTSRFELQAQEDHFWEKRFYSYVNGKYEFDRIMDLKYRYRLGLGLGYQWLEKSDFGLGVTSFNQELGMTYIEEKYDHLKEDNYGTFRYAHHYTWDIAWLSGLAFAHNFELLPQADEWTENYLIDADAGLTYALTANWQLLGKAEWDYKKKVGPDTKKSDLRYILGLGYKW